MNGNTDIKKLFGYIEGVTRCSQCGELLKEEDAYWAFGQWWHILTSDCDLN